MDKKQKNYGYLCKQQNRKERLDNYIDKHISRYNRNGVTMIYRILHFPNIVFFYEETKFETMHAINKQRHIFK